MGHRADQRRSPFAVPLADRSNRSLALIADGRQLGADEVASRVADRARDLGAHRRLILLQGGNDLDFVITYLAARSSGHPIGLPDLPDLCPEPSHPSGALPRRLALDRGQFTEVEHQ